MFTHPRISHDPSQTVLYTAVADHLETFLASLDADPDARGLPAYVERELYDYVRCGVLAHGFLRLGCDTCHHELLLAFSCKRRGFCPSCAGRRMAQTAAHLVEQVIPWVPTRQWVVSVPRPLRYWMASSQDLTAKVHTIIRTTIGQYYVNKAVTRGCARANINPGSVTFIQRFGSAINLNLLSIASSSRGSISIAPTKASRRAFSRVSHPAMPTSPPWSRRSAIGSSARYGGWDTWRR